MGFLTGSPAVIAVLATSLVALGSGCDDGEDTRSFSTAQVQKSFRIAGQPLVLDEMSSNSDFDVLEIDDADETASVFAHQRYGYFEVYVFHEEADDDVVKRVYARRPGGGPIKPDRHGIYWKQVGSDPIQWQAAKRFDNVLLSWRGDPRADRRLDKRWRNLVPIVRTVGEPKEKIVAALPKQDASCASQGISITRGASGKCKLGAQTLTVAEGSDGLELPIGRIDRFASRVAESLTSRFPITNITSTGIERGRVTLRAKGKFVVVSARVTNTARKPITYLQPALQVGSSRYERLSQSDSLLLPTPEARPFPLQPGRSATLYAAFDIPPAAARKALGDGALLLPGVDMTLLEYTPHLGALRL